MHRRWYRLPPELIILNLAIILICHIVKWICNLYHRHKKDKGPTWQCVCSRVHPFSEYECECGRTKLSGLTEKPVHRDASIQPHIPNSWVCTCGRNNAPYQSSCMCGKSKREVLCAKADPAEFSDHREA